MALIGTLVGPAVRLATDGRVGGKTYAKGDRVTKYGSVHESLVDGNTLEPGSFGSDGAWVIVASSN